MTTRITSQSSTSRGVSERGYYYDLSLSPYEYKGYKFPSAKKLELFIRESEKWLKKINESCDILDIFRVVKKDRNYYINKMHDKIYNEMKQKF